MSKNKITLCGVQASCKQLEKVGGGGKHSTMFSLLAFETSLLVSIPSVDVAEVNQWRRLEESGQWLENVD